GATVAGDCQGRPHESYGSRGIVASDSRLRDAVQGSHSRGKPCAPERISSELVSGALPNRTRFRSRLTCGILAREAIGIRLERGAPKAPDGLFACRELSECRSGSCSSSLSEEIRGSSSAHRAILSRRWRARATSTERERKSAEKDHSDACR